MIEELMKHCRRGAGGQRLLTSEQKRFIVEYWQKSQFPAAEFARRHELIFTIL